MCGIVGYTGARPAAALVLEGLKRLEYRGYDSAGLAVVSDGRIEVFKAPGKIAVLEKELGTKLPSGTTAIAHTRWATHGAPNETNAHPHIDASGRPARHRRGGLGQYQIHPVPAERHGHQYRDHARTRHERHHRRNRRSRGVLHRRQPVRQRELLSGGDGDNDTRVLREHRRHRLAHDRGIVDD